MQNANCDHSSMCSRSDSTFHNIIRLMHTLRWEIQWKFYFLLQKLKQKEKNRLK